MSQYICNISKLQKESFSLLISEKQEKQKKGLNATLKYGQ